MYTVKQARQLAGLSQDQIAKMMGVCTDTYRRIEKHPEKTTIEYAVLFCKIVQKNINEIFFDDISTFGRVSSA